jgi:hypothetical protein
MMNITTYVRREDAVIKYLGLLTDPEIFANFYIAVHKKISTTYIEITGVGLQV